MLFSAIIAVCSVNQMKYIKNIVWGEWRVLMLQQVVYIITGLFWNVKCLVECLSPHLIHSWLTEDRGRNRAVGIGTRYRLGGSGIASLWRQVIFYFHTLPNWNRSVLLCWGCFLGVKRPRRCVKYLLLPRLKN